MDNGHCALVQLLSVNPLHSQMIFSKGSVPFRTPHNIQDQSEVSALGMCFWIKDLGYLTICSKFWLSFPGALWRKATSQRTNTGFGLLSRKAENKNSELEPSPAIEILGHILVFKRHLDYNCWVTTTISLFCVCMARSTAASQSILGACRCTVYICSRQVIFVLMTSFRNAPFTFLKANTQIICCYRLMESRVVSTW